MAGGMLERDGLAVLLSYVVFVAGVVYFVVIGDATKEAMQALWRWLTQ